MNLGKSFIIFSITFLAIFVSVYSTNVFAHEDPDGYYTCPMHPQVHEHKAGSCPICGMPLVKIKGKSGEKKAEKKVESAETDGIEVSNEQIKNAQISKYTVQKKDLEINLPVSGRAVSAKEIAFQIYESDLANIKVSSEFNGKSSSNSNQVIKGRVTAIDRLVDPSSRTVRATGVIEGASDILVESGFYGEIITVLKDQILVPIEAVLHAGTRDLVYVFTPDGKLSPRTVQLGAKGKLEYQVLSGLKENEIISAGPNFLIDSEAKLRGTFDKTGSEGSPSTPQCPPDQHWDIPMTMCMPGKASK